MVKQTSRLLVILWLLSQSLLTARRTPGVATPPKKKVWDLLKKIKQASVQPPFVATMGVVLVAYLETKYVSGKFSPINNSRVKKKIQVTVRFEDKKRTFEWIKPSLTLEKVIAFVKKRTKLLPRQNKDYEYGVSHNGTKLDRTAQKQTLEALGIENNAVIELIADKQPITFHITVDNKRLSVYGDKQNTVDWLFKKADELSKISSSTEKKTFNEANLFIPPVAYTIKD